MTRSTIAATQRRALAVLTLAVIGLLSLPAQARKARTVDDVVAAVLEHMRTGDRKTLRNVFETKMFLARMQAACGTDPALATEVAKGQHNVLKFMDGPGVSGYDGGALSVVQAQMDGDSGRIVLREDAQTAPNYFVFFLAPDRKGRPRVVDFLSVGTRALQSRELAIRDALISRNYAQLLHCMGVAPEDGDVEAVAAMFAPREDRSYATWRERYDAVPERLRSNMYMQMLWVALVGQKGDEARMAALEALATDYADALEPSMLNLEYFGGTGDWARYNQVVDMLLTRWGQDEWLVARKDAQAAE